MTDVIWPMADAGKGQAAIVHCQTCKASQRLGFAASGGFRLGLAPSPIPDLRHVLAVFVDVGLVVDELVAEGLLDLFVFRQFVCIPTICRLPFAISHLGLSRHRASWPKAPTLGKRSWRW